MTEFYAPSGEYGMTYPVCEFCIERGGAVLDEFEPNDEPLREGICEWCGSLSDVRSCRLIEYPIP